MAASDARDCPDAIDLLSMRKSFIALNAKAKTGLPLENLYDQKKYHTAHSYSRNGIDQKIQRIWGTGKIRIYFIFVPKKNIVILKSAPKRVDSLSEGEKGELKKLAESVLDRLVNRNIEDVEII